MQEGICSSTNIQHFSEYPGLGKHCRDQTAPDQGLYSLPLTDCTFWMAQRLDCGKTALLKKNNNFSNFWGFYSLSRQQQNPFPSAKKVTNFLSC